MASAAVICAACGAKVKSGRVKCLRCRELLVARQDAAGSRPIPWKTAGLVTALVALGGVAVVFTGRTTPSPRRGTSQGVGGSRVLNAAPARSTAASRSAAESTPASAAVSDLITGERELFRHEYHYNGPTGECRFTLAASGVTGDSAARVVIYVCCCPARPFLR